MTDRSEPVFPSGFVLWAEVDPPKGTDLGRFIASARLLARHGLTVVVTDGAQAVMRMTPLGPARFLLEEGISPIVMLGGRDRNRLSFQGDLLAAWALGIRRVLLTMGTPLAQGDQTLARSAGDLDLALMLEGVMRLGRGEDLGGAALDAPCDIKPGVLISPTRDPGENRRRAIQASRLAELGATFLVLGPTYDREHVALFSEAANLAGVPLIASLMWLRSVALVRYWNQLPNAPRIPDGILANMMKARGGPAGSMDCAMEMLRFMRQHRCGVLLTAPGWEEHLPAILDQLSWETDDA